MLSIGGPKPAGINAGYYWQYYSRDSNGVGIWFGDGAKFFGLKDLISKRPFLNLIHGFSPDGKRGLVKNAGDPGRQSFWDLTFSAPKDVAILWMMSDEKFRKKIDRCIFRALEKTLHKIEDEFGFSRRGAGGKRQVKAKLTFALFRHICSRANEPFLHWHCLLFNLGIREDGTTGTLRTQKVYENKLALGAFFRNGLEQELVKDLRLEIKREEHTFSIVGIPKNVTQFFSSRRKTILDYMAARGWIGGKEAQIAASETRPPKEHVPEDVLISKWRKEAAELGFTKEMCEKILGQPRLTLLPNAKHPTLEHIVPKTKDEIFLEWWTKAREVGWDAKKITTELGSVYLKEMSEPEGKSTRHETAFQKTYWEGLIGSAFSYFETELEAARTELESERREFVKGNFRLIKGGAEELGPKEQEKAQNKPFPKLEIIRLDKPSKASPEEEQNPIESFREELRKDLVQIAPEFLDLKGVTKRASELAEKYELKREDVLSIVVDLVLKRAQHKSAPELEAKRAVQGEKIQSNIQSEEKTEHENAKFREQTKPRDEQKAENSKYKSYKKSSKKTWAKKKESPTGEPPNGKSKKPAIRAFRLKLREEVDKIWPQDQKVKRILKLAHFIAKDYGVERKEVHDAVRWLKLPAHGRVIRVEWHPVFPDAPGWNPYWNLRIPKLVIFDRPKKWGEVYWSKPIPAIGGPVVELRVQQRFLFPKAPWWSPAKGLSLKALHFGPVREWAYDEETGKVKPEKKHKKKEKSKKKHDHDNDLTL